MAFCSGNHVFWKAVSKAGVLFPTTKKEIIEKLGDVEVQVSDDTFVKAASIVNNLPIDSFENGSEFWCAVTSAQFLNI